MRHDSFLIATYLPNDFWKSTKRMQILIKSKIQIDFLDCIFFVYLPRALDAFMDATENSNPRDK